MAQRSPFGDLADEPKRSPFGDLPDDAPAAPAVPGMRGMPLPDMPSAPQPNVQPVATPSTMASALGQGVRRGIGKLTHSGEGMLAAANDPMAALRSAGDAMQATRERGEQQGGLAGGTHKLLANIPLIGPELSERMEEAGRGGDEFARSLGDTGVQATALALPESGIATESVPRAWAARPRPFQADPFVAATRALKPTPSAEGLPLNLRQNIAAVKKYSPGFEPSYDPATGTTNIAEGFKAARMAHHEALEPYLNRAQGYGSVPHQGIVDATQDVVNSLPASERAAAQQYVARAQQDWANLSPRDMRAQIDRYNARDASFYAKGTPGQSAALSQAEQAIDKAQADAARNALYKHISPEDEGAGPRAIRGQAGNLHELENSALRRTGSIVAEQPLTPFGRAIEPAVAPLKAAWGAIRGNPSTGISYAADSGSRSIPLLRKAFSAVNEDYAPLPRPASEMFPTIPPSRQLGPGTTRTGNVPLGRTQTGNIRPIDETIGSSRGDILRPGLPLRSLPSVDESTLTPQSRFRAIGNQSRTELGGGELRPNTYLSAVPTPSPHRTSVTGEPIRPLIGEEPPLPEQGIKAQAIRPAKTFAKRRKE